LVRAERSRGWALAGFSGPALFVSSFALLIAIGTAGFLLLPGLYTGEGLDFIDALFTATSAVCVTGLIVVDTATFFTIWGQFWILLLIQLGGLGLITLSSIIMGVMGMRLSLRTEAIAVAAPMTGTRVEVWRLAFVVVRFTLAVEAVGAAILFLLWRDEAPWHETLWHAVFQSVSAFCNAGFSTWSDSLVGHSRDPASLTVMSLLIVTGGLGYLVLHETWLGWRAGLRRQPNRLSTNSWAALAVTGGLLVTGTLAYLVLEWDGVLAPFGFVDRLSNAWFMSVTARTAGFNTVDYAILGNDAVLVTILLMFVGGSPGSTAGGIKTTTLAVLVAMGISRFRGRRFVALHDRGLPAETIERAVSLTVLAVVVLTVAVLVLNTSHGDGLGIADQRARFLPILFESVSAFATVGLSMGTTGTMGDAGNLVTILLMFVGRVGLFSFFAAMALRQAGPRARLRLAEEDLFVG
jgi:trk system potassium uptake protein TrkH